MKFGLPQSETGNFDSFQAYLFTKYIQLNYNIAFSACPPVDLEDKGVATDQCLGMCLGITLTT